MDALVYDSSVLLRLMDGENFQGGESCNKGMIGQELDCDVLEKSQFEHETSGEIWN